MTRIVIAPVAMMLTSLLLACSTPGLVKEVDGLRVLSSRPGGTQLHLLADSARPVLVVKSPRGIGQASLSVPAILPQGLTIEFPGFRSLEQLVLDDGQRRLVCTGGTEERAYCSWGEEWPVGLVRRYPSGMTVELPASMFARAGKWQLEWVDYWR